jgi:RNA polymerase sigma factor (sigma-70 family)
MIRGTGKVVIRDIERLLVEGTTAGASDEQLLSRFAAARDRSSLAFEAIVRRHGPMVLETCRRLLEGDHHAAEDAFQTTFLVLARRAGAIRVRPAGSLGPWLHEVACRTARKARIARLRRQNREALATVGPDAIDDEPGHPIEALDEYRVLHEEVSRLPEKYRVAIVLCYLEGLTQDQAAATLRWPVGTVRGYLARARDLLRNRLVRRGVAPLAAIGLMECQAKAAVSPPLIESVLDAFVHGVAAPTAAGLSAELTGGLAVSKVRRLMATLVLLALGAGGAGLVASLPGSSSGGGSGPEAIPLVAAQPAPSPGQRERLDLHGDPLPAGAVARLGTSRFNHGNNIQNLAYMPDGKALLSFGSNGHIHAWEPETGRPLRTVVVGNSRGSYLFALSPDARRLITADRSPAGTFQIWDFATGHELRRVRIPEPTMNLSIMRYSPDGKALATALFDQCIVFFDVETLEELRRVNVRANYVQHIAFSPDGKLLAAAVQEEPVHFEGLVAGGGGGAGLIPDTGGNSPRPDPSEKAALVICDVARAAELRRIEIRGRHPEGLIFSPDGKHLVAPSCDQTIRFYDPHSGQEMGQVKVSGSTGGPLAISHDGTILAMGTCPPIRHPGDPAEIRLFDMRNRREVRRFPANDQAVFELAFSPDDRRLASVGGDKLVRLWDVATGGEINAVASHRSSVACLAVSPSGDSVITGGYDDAIRRWDAATGREVRVIGRHPGAVYDMAISPDGRSLLAADIDLNVRLWDLAAKKPTYRSLTINPDSRGRSVAISPDGRLAASSGKISDVATARELATLLDENGEPFKPWAWAAFTPDNTGLIATDGSAIWLWDAAGGKPVRRIAAPGAQIMSVAISPDGRFLAAGVDNAVRLWHLATGREIYTRMRHDAGYVVAAFSPDGRLIVSGCGYDMTSDDPSVRVWEVASDQEVRRFNGHQAGIYSVAFFRDGHRVASAGSDALAMVWDLALEAEKTSHGTELSRPPDLERLWADLGNDASRAYRAIWRMSANAEQVVPFLAERLKPIRQDDPDKDTSLGPLATGETLRRLRATALLEKINTPAALRVLERMATGLEGARETRDARSALRRLN